MKYPIKHVNGIKAYLIAGTWYCDWNNYRQTRHQQGINPNEDAFFNFCQIHDLCPTG